MEGTMTLDGTVRDGIIVLENGVQIPDGTRVQVVVADEPVERPSLLSLLKLAGAVKGLPADFAAQHDHYIHGTPKR
jgi:hypothetical protein